MISKKTHLFWGHQNEVEGNLNHSQLHELEGRPFNYLLDLTDEVIIPRSKIPAEGATHLVRSVLGQRNLQIDNNNLSVAT